MHYAILCYNDERMVEGLTKEEDDAVIAKRQVVQEKLAAEGRLGPVARLMPTTAATTLRAGRETLVLDGPFAETKEQLLGFYIVDCTSLEQAIAAARALKGDETSGAFEIRPLRMFRPGGARQAAEA
jgi:hypothetical protein